MDQDHPDQDLKVRVERLERQVEVLRKELKMRVSHGEREPRGPERASGPTPSATAPPFESAFEPRPHASPRPPPKGFSARDILENAEVWLPRVGIGLLLLAVAFAFKYSIDQGWVIPAVRVASGYVLGLALLVAGFKLSDSRPGYVQALFGGAIATFYITGFSAFQLYGLFSYPFAFGLMVAATMLAFFLSLQLDRAALSVIGVMGGLGTPFLLYTGSGNVPGLIAYTTLVLAGASAVYFHRGWRPLLQVAVVGGLCDHVARGRPPERAPGDVADGCGDAAAPGREAVRSGSGKPGRDLVHPAVHGGGWRLSRPGLRVSQPAQVGSGGGRRVRVGPMPG